MKSFIQITESAYIRSITTAANKLVDTHLAQDLSEWAQFLSPQCFAAYAGLKKLIEKDYRQEEDVYSLALTNA